jgi:hypothetical protein
MPCFRRQERRPRRGDRRSGRATPAEFKLASNSKLRQNLENQLKVYEGANETKQSIAVILCFSEDEVTKTENILKGLGLADSKHAVVIDASPTNKPSGSAAKSSSQQ